MANNEIVLIGIKMKLDSQVLEHAIQFKLSDNN